MSFDQFLRIRDAVRISGLSRSQIYRLSTLGQFPSPIKLSERCSGWIASEVEAWQKARIAAARDSKSEA
jgi:prophage regulatory protein